MANYETVFIVTPVLNEADLKKTIDKYIQFIKDGNAKIVHENHWGLKQLAYPIKKKTTGVYHVVEYSSEDTGLIEKLEIAFKRDEDILRFLTIRLDKYALKYNEDKRNGLIGKKNASKEATVEEPANTEA